MNFPQQIQLSRNNHEKKWILSPVSPISLKEKTIPHPSRCVHTGMGSKPDLDRRKPSFCLCGKAALFYFPEGFWLVHVKRGQLLVSFDLEATSISVIRLLAPVCETSLWTEVTVAQEFPLHGNFNLPEMLLNILSSFTSSEVKVRLNQRSAIWPSKEPIQRNVWSCKL